MERHGVGLDVAFAPFSQSSAAASSSETAAVQLRIPDASPRTRPGTVATLSYDSSPNTKVSQLKASQRTSPGNSSQGIISSTIINGYPLLCARNEHLWMQSSYVSIDCSFCWKGHPRRIMARMRRKDTQPTQLSLHSFERLLLQRIG